MKILISLLFLSVILQGGSGSIYDFKKEKSTSNWYVVNDGVMGGLSKSKISINDSGNAVFNGYVTTENNGGFASVRHTFNKKIVDEYEHIVLKVKGDGKTYQFRIKEKSSQRYSYTTSFQTTGEWEIIKIPFDSFYPSFRGYDLDIPNYTGEIMEEIAILIGNKRKESFSLEIENIVLE
jgi:hypothetical protein